MRGNWLLVLGLGLSLVACGDKDDDTGDGDGGDTDVGTDSDTDSGGADTDTDTDTDTGPTLSSIALPDPTFYLVINEQAELAAQGLYSDGSVSDLTDSCAWEVDDASIASVDAALLSGLAAGEANVSCTVDGVSGAAAVVVSGLDLSVSTNLLGHPVGGAAVWVTGPDGTSWEAGSTDDVGGALDISGLGYGTYTVWADVMGAPMSPASVDITFDDATTAVDPQVFTVVGQAYPTDVDAVASDDDAGTATPLTLDGALRTHTLWPWGDEDWFSLELTEGDDIQVFTANLSVQSDTYIEVYDATGTEWLEYNDDWISLDSNARFEAPATGSYRFRVRAYDEGVGVAQYQIGALTWADQDADGQGSFHDCLTTDSRYQPWTEFDEAADGVDYTCDGHIDETPETPDPVDAAGTDTAVTPRPTMLATTESWYLFNGAEMAANQATLHNETDADWWSVEIPAFGWVSVNLRHNGEEVESPDVTVWEIDGVTEVVLDSDYQINLENETGAPLTKLLKVENLAGVPLTYVLRADDYGMDQDADDSFSQDWGRDRDCDDNDPAVGTDCYPEDTGWGWDSGLR
jgi:hypothetical protein